MMRYKTVIGRCLPARTLPAHKTDAAVGCKLLNVMAHHLSLDVRGYRGSHLNYSSKSC
jgi:hypothetical protein